MADKNKRLAREIEACRRSLQNIECYQRALLLVAKEKRRKRAALGEGTE